MIRKISIENQAEWDSVVRSLSNYDVFYLSGYSRAFMKESSKNGKLIPLFYGDDGECAINVAWLWWLFGECMAPWKERKPRENISSAGSSLKN